MRFACLSGGSEDCQKPLQAVILETTSRCLLRRRVSSSTFLIARKNPNDCFGRVFTKSMINRVGRKQVSLHSALAAPHPRGRSRRVSHKADRHPAALVAEGENRGITSEMAHHVGRLFFAEIQVANFLLAQGQQPEARPVWDNFQRLTPDFSESIGYLTRASMSARDTSRGNLDTR